MRSQPEIRFYAPDMVRVTHPTALSAGRPASALPFVVLNPSMAPGVLQSDRLVVKVDELGCVSFRKPGGELLFAEKGVFFAPCKDGPNDAFRVRHEVALDRRERIFGFGQIQNGALNQRGRTVDLKNRNMNIAIPVLHSAKGYGVFWNHACPMTFVDTESGTSMDFTDTCLDYFFLLGGDAGGVVRAMRRLTGQVPLLPLWAYGYWQSRERYKNQAELLEVVARYRELGVPLDCIVQDWQYWGDAPQWNAMRFKKEIFPDPQGMVDEVHRQNARIMVVAWPGFGPETEPYREFDAKGMLLDFRTWPPETFAKPYDVYNPAARARYWDYLNKGVFSLGVDGIWLDSTEPDHIDMKDRDYDVPTHLGTFRHVHNAFPLAHAGGVDEHWRKTNPAKRVVLLTRCASAGQQRTGSVSWSGDVQSRWEALAKQIPAGLGFTMTGNPTWNADIGGFFAGHFTGPKDPRFQELYTRWLQFACFTPMMRSHGTNHPREIYQFGERGQPVFDILERFIRLRYALLPYIYSTAWEVSRHGDSFMRPLVMAFPGEEKLHDIADQYLFGRSLLVAPVVTEGATHRDVVLPSGAWVDFWTRETVAGGQTVRRATPLDILPLYVKAGSVLPMGPDVQYATEKPWDALELAVYPGADGSFTLYEDAGDGYAYEQGAFTEIPMTWHDFAATLEIGSRRGSFPGMLTARKFRVFGTDIPYDGRPVSVRRPAG